MPIAPKGNANDSVVIGKVSIITAFTCECPVCETANHVHRPGNVSAARVQCTACDATFIVRQPVARATA